jgi:hypothetical protein
VLFINDEYLVVAQNNNLKYIKTDEFLSKTANRSDNKINPGTALENRGCQKEESKIKYFQEYSVSMNIDDNLAEYAVNGPSFSQRRKDKRSMRMGSLADDPEENYGGNERFEPAGSSNTEVNQRHKEMIGTRSLYGALREYEKSEVITLEFKNCLLAGEWKILAVDETFSSISSSNSANTIVVYASMEGQLILQVYKLCVENFNVAVEYSDNESFGQQTIKDQDNLDFVEIGGQKGVKSRGDSYTGIQIVSISENQTLTIL